MSSGGGSPTQYAVQTGPTPAAAQEAMLAQYNSAAVAGQEAQMQTNNALSTLVNEYGTALQYSQPTINTGQQAAAQINYMMGLPAVAPGVAPTAPTMPTAAQTITPAMIQQYEQANTTFDNDNGPNYTPNSSGGMNFNIDDYTGVGAHPSILANGTYNENDPGNTIGWNQAEINAYGAQGNGTGWYSSLNQLFNDPSVNSAVQNQLYQNELPQLQQQYNTNLTQFDQQNNEYENQLNLYNNYNAKGPATAADISSIVNNLPGFQFQSNQGISGIQNAASASGLLNSGSLLQNLDQFSQGLSSTYFNNYISQLGGLASAGNAASSQAGVGASNVGNAGAQLYSQLGDNLGNAALSQGQAMASSYLSPLSSQQMQVTPIGSSQGSGLGGLGSILSGIGSIAGSGIFSSGGSSIFSSKELKVKLNTPTKEEILENVKALEIDRWEYKDIKEPHIGPYAEEFSERFKVGNGQKINIIDALGVIFKSIQALSSQIDELKSNK